MSRSVGALREGAARTAALCLKVVLWWLAILALAVVNGLVRQKLLIPAIGSVAGLLTSGSILSGVIFLVAYAAVPGFLPVTPRRCWTVGLAWLALTLTFELSFGLFVMHKPFVELLQAYTFKDGNLWPVVLASTLISPRLAARVRRLV